jgi:hypothetical protein
MYHVNEYEIDTLIRAEQEIKCLVFLVRVFGREILRPMFANDFKDEYLLQTLKQETGSENVFEVLEYTLNNGDDNKLLKRVSMYDIVQIPTEDIFKSLNSNEILNQALQDISCNKYLEHVLKIVNILNNRKLIEEFAIERPTLQKIVHEPVIKNVASIDGRIKHMKLSYWESNRAERQGNAKYNPLKKEMRVLRGCYLTNSITNFKDVILIPTLTEDNMNVVKYIQQYIDMQKQHEVTFYTEISMVEMKQGENCSLEVAFEDENNNTKRKLTLQLNVVTSDMFEDAMNNAQMQSIVLTYSNIFPSDCRMFIALPVYEDGFINRKDRIIAGTYNYN